MIIKLFKPIIKFSLKLILKMLYIILKGSFIWLSFILLCFVAMLKMLFWYVAIFLLQSSKAFEEHSKASLLLICAQYILLA